MSPYRRGLEPLGQELGRDDERDHHEDQHARPTEGQARGPVDQPPLVHVDERHEHADRDEVLCGQCQGPDRAVDRIAHDRLGQATEHDVDVADEQDGRADEQQVVHRPDAALAEHPWLEEGVPDDAPGPDRDLARRIRGDRVDGLEDPPAADHQQGEDRERAPEDREDQRVCRDLGEGLEHRGISLPRT